MTSNDIGNSIFEIIGGILQVRNAYQIYKDKEVKGVFWPAWLFFTVWGYWNLYYYPSLGQWYSFVGGILIAVANTAWVSMAWYYTRKR
jgi:hypothetical protein